MTDISQIFGVDKSLIVWCFDNSTIIVIVSFILIFNTIYNANKSHLANQKLLITEKLHGMINEQIEWN